MDFMRHLLAACGYSCFHGLDVGVARERSPLCACEDNRHQNADLLRRVKSPPYRQTGCGLALLQSLHHGSTRFLSTGIDALLSSRDHVLLHPPSGVATQKGALHPEARWVLHASCFPPTWHVDRCLSGHLYRRHSCPRYHQSHHHDFRANQRQHDLHQGSSVRMNSLLSLQIANTTLACNVTAE